MLVVVTGANGHLGSNVVPALLAAGHDVRATVHRNANVLDRLGVEQVPASILDSGALDTALRGADAVIHMAAKISISGDPDGSVARINVEGTHNVAVAARHAGCRMVHMSSVHAFSLSTGPAIVRETHPRSGSRNYAYDQSKAAGEDAVRSQVSDGLDATILNPAGIIGPSDPGPSRMGLFFLSLRDGRLPALVAGGFDWVDVRDVAHATVRALADGAPGENYLLGGHYATMVELAEMAAQCTGQAPPRLVVPIWLAAAGVPLARLRKRHDPVYTLESLGALRHGKPIDSSRARQVLGHEARPLVETVRGLYDWFAAEGR